MRDIKKMNRIKEGVKKFKNSKFFLFILALAIGVSFSVSYYEGKKLWAEYRSAIEYLELRHTLVSAGVSAEAEESSLVNTEREVESTQSPLPLEEILDRIYQLESSSGVNDTCHPNGHNGYGFGQHKTSNLCFGSDKEARNAVKVWFQKKLQTYTLEESLRIYHCGSLACGEDYVAKFNSIIN